MRNISINLKKDIETKNKSSLNNVHINVNKNILKANTKISNDAILNNQNKYKIKYPKFPDYSQFCTEQQKNPPLKKKNYVLLEIVHKNNKKKREIEETENKQSNETNNYHARKTRRTYDVQKIVNLKSNHQFHVSNPNLLYHNGKKIDIDSGINERKNHVLKETSQIYKFARKNLLPENIKNLSLDDDKNISKENHSIFATNSTENKTEKKGSDISTIRITKKKKLLF